MIIENSQNGARLLGVVSEELFVELDIPRCAHDANGQVNIVHSQMWKAVLQAMFVWGGRII